MQKSLKHPFCNFLLQAGTQHRILDSVHNGSPWTPPQVHSFSFSSLFAGHVYSIWTTELSTDILRDDDDNLANDSDYDDKLCHPSHKF